MADLNENRPGQSAEALAKAGYKKTKVGWIPEEWEVKNLIDLAEKIMVGIASSATHAYSDKGVVLFRNQNIKEDGLDTSDLLYVTEEYEQQHKNKRLKGGDVLTVRTGYPGISAVVPDKFEGAQCFTSLITRPQKDILDSEWLAFYINSPLGKRLILGAEAGGAQKNVNAGALQKLKIPYLPLPEQRGIARILSTWDAAIDKLGQLIAKKQALKKGLMQQLLSGRVRFPEFVPPGGTRYKETKVGVVPEDWEVVRIKDVGYVKLPQISPSSDISYNYFSIPAFEAGAPDIINGAEIRSNKIQVEAEDILFGKLNPRVWKVWKVAPIKPELSSIASTEFLPVRCNSKYHVDYIYQQLFSTPLKKQVLARIGGSTGSHQRINPKDFYSLKILIPSYLEQKKIAESLNQFDSEIRFLESQRNYFETQKKGLMQQLLTGAVRVKETNSHERE